MATSKRATTFNPTRGAALFVILLISVSCTPGQVSTNAGYLRSAIETYPDAEGRPILEYLDGARLVADDAAAMLVSGNVDPLVAQISSLPRAGSGRDIRYGLELMRTQYGLPVATESRSQAIESQAVPPDVHDLERVTATSFYSLRTATRPHGEVFLIIRTARAGSQHQVVGMQAIDYLGKVPPWLAGPP